MNAARRFPPRPTAKQKGLIAPAAVDRYLLLISVMRALQT